MGIKCQSKISHHLSFITIWYLYALDIQQPHLPDLNSCFPIYFCAIYSQSLTVGLIMLLFVSLALAFTPYDLGAIENNLKQVAEYRAHRDLDYYPALPISGYELAAKTGISTGILPVTDHNSQLAWGIAIFDIKLERLYNAVNDELQHTGMTPVDYTRIVKGAPCTNKRQVLMHMPIPLLSNRWWVTTQSNNPALYQRANGKVAELSWSGITDITSLDIDAEASKKIEGAVYVSFNKGAWFFIQLDEAHTLAEYFTWSDPGGSIPTSLKSYAVTFTADSIVDTFSAMEKYARENEPKCNIF